MSMIERVAKAICKDIDQTEDDWQFMLTTAKAAIEAMREPTEAMKHAVNEHGDEIHYSYNCQVYGGVAEGYKAMIDAALKDG